MKENAKRTLEALVESHLISVISNAFSISRHSKRSRRTILASDVLTALKLEGTPLDLPTNAGYSDNTTVDLNAFLNGETNQQLQDDPPSEMGMVMHWLAVEGRQPATPLNPIALLKSTSRNEKVQKQNNSHAFRNGNEIDDSDTFTDDETHNEEPVAIRNLQERLLSEELQLYFTRITFALQKGDTQAQDSALLRLRYDSGIQELVTFLIHFLTPTGDAQMADVQRSRLRIQCIRNLALNPNLHLEIHLQQIIPLIMNCIVPKKLSYNPYDHFKLRDEASRTLLVLLFIFSKKYDTFQPSVISVLCQALSSYSLESRYGALVALSDMGPKVVDAVVLPIVAQFWIECEIKLKNCPDDGVRFGLHRLQDALLVRLCEF